MIDGDLFEEKTFETDFSVNAHNGDNRVLHFLIAGNRVFCSAIGEYGIKSVVIKSFYAILHWLVTSENTVNLICCHEMFELLIAELKALSVGREEDV